MGSYVLPSSVDLVSKQPAVIAGVKIEIKTDKESHMKNRKSNTFNGTLGAVRKLFTSLIIVLSLQLQLSMEA